MKVLVLDIETIPCQNLPAECVPQFDPESVKYGNIKDPAKRKEKEDMERASFEESLIKKMSVDPALAQLCTFVGIEYDTEEEEAIKKTSVQVSEDGDDLEAIADGWDAIKRMYNERTPVVSFNGISFDLPIMLYRAIAQDVPVDPFMYRRLTAKWNNPFHYDLMQLLSGWQRERWHSLDFYLRFFGIGEKTDGMDGSRVYPAWKAKEFSKIQEYCEHDVMMTCELFTRVESWILMEAAEALNHNFTMKEE